MTTGRPRQMLAIAGRVAVVALALGLSVGIGGLMPSRPVIAGLAAVTVLAFGLTLADPAVIPLLMLAPLLLISRLALTGVDLSVSDLALFVAFLPAFLLGSRPYSPQMRALLWLTVVYQAATMFTVIANPYTANTIEWFHAWLLTAGALMVGWTIGHEGHARIGLDILVATSLFLAFVTIVQGLEQYAGGDFGAVYPTWPVPMHKNFVGCVLGFAAALTYTRPVWLGWTKRWSLVAFWICVVGILVTQSRQALVGLALVLIVIVVRTDPDRRRSKIIILGLTPALVLVGSLAKDQFATGNRFNSLFQRLAWFKDSLDVWSSNPPFGAGLRWWYTDRFPVSFQPPNAEIEVLSSAGLVGLAGFLILMLGAVRVLWKIDPRYGTVAIAVLLSRFVQGQLDLFWVAAQTSLPFVIVGICLGAQALRGHEEQTAASAAAAPPRRARA